MRRASFGGSTKGCWLDAPGSPTGQIPLAKALEDEPFQAHRGPLQPLGGLLLVGSAGAQGPWCLERLVGEKLLQCPPADIVGLGGQIGARTKQVEGGSAQVRRIRDGHGREPARPSLIQ
jgi:hypothetical protein